MGSTHLRALASTSLEVAAVVEPVAALREGLSTRTHADVDELLDAGGFDAALVAAPTDLHAGLVERFAAAGIPVLCEKPCGLTSTEAQRAARAAAEAGVVLQIGYWRRFVPELVALRERLAAGALGDLLTVGCWQWDGEPPSPAFRARSGGILVDMGVHELDQIRWLSGADIVELTTAPSALDPDSLQALALLSTGATATVSLGRRFPHGDCCWVEVMGTAGHARWEFMWGPPGEQVFLAALAAQAEAFAEAVRGAPQRGASGEDAVRALAAVELAA
jgi:myo-inositol 2-dehydrogenase/D-chiro-inositol 1-dehydrogenase